MREVTERQRPPRALYCPFPLGRPLGVPRDPAFQHRVLAAALALLGEQRGPVLADFPETVEQALDQPLACAVPLSEAAGDEPAAAEARGLRAAYLRTVARRGSTNVGRLAGPDEIPGLLGRFADLAAGASPEEVGLGAEALMPGSSDIRAYYEEAALALADHVPAAGQTDAWLYERTAAGQVLRDAWLQLSTSGLPELDWLYVVPRAFWPGQAPPAVSSAGPLA